ncbi:MAG: DUF2764 family protein [Candidatus Omnitrophica bacterium]|nr:DUF2764 family protein [Candidatus Omnitrophota bacterium]
MTAYYTYLISSLPMLHFGTKPPFPFDKFCQLCEGLIPDKNIDILKKASWLAFDRALRNELVKIRAAHKKLDPLKYLREKNLGQSTRGQSPFFSPNITNIALHAYRTPSILEAEKFLDQARWRFLDELAIGHYFDIDYLIVYANKLLILERWERINTLDRVKALEKALA